MTEPTKPTADLVPIRAPDGSVGTVPRDQLAQAIDAGAQVVDETTLAKAKLQADYGGAGGQLAAGAAGAARGLTLGLSDVAASAIGGDETRQTLENLKEANPYASIGGELVGAVAPAFLSGGASAAAEGLTVGKAIRGLGALPRGVTALGGLAERGVAGAVGEGLGGRLLSHAAAGAVEGGIYGAGNAISEDALGDHEFTAESLLSGMKHGIIAGGLLGAAGGLFSRAPRAAERDIEAVVGNHLGDASPGLAKAARELDGFDSAAEAYINRTADSPEQARLLSEAWRRREQLLGKHEQTLEEATRKVTSHLDDAIKAERAVDAVSFGEAKSNQMAKLVEPANWRGAKDTALNVWEDATNTINELMADPTRGGAGVAVGRAAKWLEKFGKQLGETATGDKTQMASELFSQLDDFKRAIGQGAQFGKGPFGLPEAAREFDALYHRIRGALENEEVWGKAATAQKEVNLATQARLATRNEFGANFTKQYGSEAGRPLYVANPEGASSYVRGLTSAKNDLKHRALQDYITNEENFLATVERHYDIPAAEKAQIAQARKAFSGLRSTIDETSKEVTVVNQLRQLRSEEQQAGLGGILGLATDIGTRPLKTLERLAEIENTAKRIDNTLRKGVRSFFSGDESAAVKAPPVEVRASPATARAPSRPSREFVPHPNAKGHETTVMVNAGALDRSWQREGGGYYIPKGGGGAEIKGRREGFEKFLETGKPIQASRVTYNPDTDVASFIDGRHRFSVLRDQGASEVPITIPKSEMKGLPASWRAREIGGESADQEFERISKQVKEVAADPERQASAMGKHAEAIADVAPKTAGHMSAVATRAATFLASKLPPERIDPNSLTPHLERPRVSDSERDRFLRYARAAYSPTTVPEDLGRGRISREAVEAMQFVAPRMYERTAEHIDTELRSLKKPLPYQKELQLKVFLQRPAMDPGLFKAIQGGFDEQRAEKRQRSQNPVPFKLTNDIRSASERVETR